MFAAAFWGCTSVQHHRTHVSARQRMVVQCSASILSSSSDQNTLSWRVFNSRVHYLEHPWSINCQHPVTVKRYRAFACAQLDHAHQHGRQNAWWVKGIQGGRWAVGGGRWKAGLQDDRSSLTVAGAKVPSPLLRKSTEGPSITVMKRSGKPSPL